MRRLLQKVRFFCQSEAGPTSVEYAILLVLVLAVYLTAVQTFGRNTGVLFERANTAIQSSSNGP